MIEIEQNIPMKVLFQIVSADIIDKIAITCRVMDIGFSMLMYHQVHTYLFLRIEGLVQYE